MGCIWMRPLDAPVDLVSRQDAEVPLALLDGKPGAHTMRNITRVIARQFTTTITSPQGEQYQVPFATMDGTIRLEGQVGARGGMGIPEAIPDCVTKHMQESGGCIRIRVSGASENVQGVRSYT